MVEITKTYGSVALAEKDGYAKLYYSSRLGGFIYRKGEAYALVVGD